VWGARPAGCRGDQLGRGTGTVEWAGAGDVRVVFLWNRRTSGRWTMKLRDELRAGRRDRWLRDRGRRNSARQIIIYSGDGGVDPAGGPSDGLGLRRVTLGVGGLVPRRGHNARTEGSRWPQGRTRGRCYTCPTRNLMVVFVAVGPVDGTALPLLFR